MIKVGGAFDGIFHDGITLPGSIMRDITPKRSHCQCCSNLLEDGFIVRSQTDLESRIKLAMTILVDYDDGPEMSFTIGKASHPIPEVIRNFQVKTKSFLHDNLPNLKPTSPQFLLPGQEAGGQRADGLHNQKTARLLTTSIIAENRSIVNG